LMSTGLRSLHHFTMYRTAKGCGLLGATPVSAASFRLRNRADAFMRPTNANSDQLRFPDVGGSLA
jgi:hypothetical protein